MNSRLDVYIWPERDKDPVVADNSAIRRLRQLADGYRASDYGGNRLRTHLILKNQALVNVLRRVPLDPDMAADIELYAYTMEDLWSMEVLGIRPGTNPLLDRIPITPESGSRVHLVLFGSGAQAESLAVHSALVAHYPNYCRDNRLRTRITWVSDSMTDFARFKQQYKGLLENSWRRNVTISGADVEIDASAPKYANERQDFIDVEWEFVEARGSDDIMLYKLARWSHDEDRQLTVAICYEDDSRNINEALAMKLPDSVPVLVRVDDDASLMFLKQSGHFGHIIPMGMKAADLPSMTDFIHMAQCVNYAYCNMRESTEDERRQGAAEMNVALELPSPEELQGLWNSPKLTTAKRWSNIYNAFTVNTKMRSLGLGSDDIDFYAVGRKDLEMMAEVEHNRWSVEEMILGYIPTTSEEHRAILEDITKRSQYKAEFKHDDLRNFSELGVDETGLPVSRYDVGLIRSLPLIAYAGRISKKLEDE